LLGHPDELRRVVSSVEYGRV